MNERSIRVSVLIRLHLREIQALPNRVVPHTADPRRRRGDSQIQRPRAIGLRFPGLLPPRFDRGQIVQIVGPDLVVIRVSVLPLVGADGVIAIHFAIETTASTKLFLARAVAVTERASPV